MRETVALVLWTKHNKAEKKLENLNLSYCCAVGDEGIERITGNLRPGSNVAFHKFQI